MGSPAVRSMTTLRKAMHMGFAVPALEEGAMWLIGRHPAERDRKKHAQAENEGRCLE